MLISHSTRKFSAEEKLEMKTYHIRLASNRVIIARNNSHISEFVVCTRMLNSSIKIYDGVNVLGPPFEGSVESKLNINRVQSIVRGLEGMMEVRRIELVHSIIFILDQTLA